MKKNIYSMLFVLFTVTGIGFFIFSAFFSNSWLRSISILFLAETICVDTYLYRKARQVDKETKQLLKDDKRGKVYTRLNILFIIIGIVILAALIFTPAPVVICSWLDIVRDVFIFMVLIFNVLCLREYQNEKIENVDDEEIKRLLKKGKKVDAIKKIKEDNKCSLLKAIFYVGDIEKSLK